MINLSITIEPTTLDSGEQKDYMDDILYPNPESYFHMNSSISLNYFFNDNIGIDTTYSLLRNTRADNDAIENSLMIYNHQTIDLGVIFRFIKYSYSDKYYSFYLAGGALYSILNYDKEFNEFFDAEISNNELSDISSEWGWYGKVGVHYNINRYFLLGMSLKMSFLNNYIQETNSNFDGFYIGWPVYIGFSI